MRKLLVKPEFYIAAVIAGVVLVSFLYRPGAMPPLSFCGFKTMTGVPCPFCGMTRSFCASAQQHWGDAVRFHPVGPILFAGVALVMLTALLDLITRGGRLRWVGVQAARLPAWAWFALIVGLWGVRLASFLLLDAPA